MLERILIIPTISLVSLLQSLPLILVARIGRFFGAFFYFIDASHRKTTLKNLSNSFGEEKTSLDIRKIAKEHFRRLGENYCCAIKTASMSDEEISKIIEPEGFERFRKSKEGQLDQSLIVAAGHFGNFELMARTGIFIPGYTLATPYRRLKHPLFTKLMKKVRQKSGTLYFDRQSEGKKLRKQFKPQGWLLGFLSDQHGGNRGIPSRFFGQECSTSQASVSFALRYNCPLYTMICFRNSPGRWKIRLGDQIPTKIDGNARPVHEIIQAINDEFEKAVREDPPNWFWVHRRWKRVKRKLPQRGKQP
ncbi:MAG TPA: hypothetical protein EYQ50_11610 [Verrucomicrobiales bacterium]|nr:hypothetical protein [Verrucomicrobiales bacterium]